MHEERFSGSKRTANAWQMGWTFYNMLLEDGKTTEEIESMSNNKVDNFPDYFLYELTKAGMTVDAIAKKMNTTPQEVAMRLDRYEELATVFNPMKAELDAKLKKERSGSSDNIG